MGAKLALLETTRYEVFSSSHERLSHDHNDFLVGSRPYSDDTPHHGSTSPSGQRRGACRPVKVIAFVDRELGIQTTEDEISEMNFASLNGIARCVAGNRERPVS